METFAGRFMFLDHTGSSFFFICLLVCLFLAHVPVELREDIRRHVRSQEQPFGRKALADVVGESMMEGNEIFIQIVYKFTYKPMRYALGSFVARV